MDGLADASSWPCGIASQAVAGSKERIRIAGVYIRNEHARADVTMLSRSNLLDDVT